MAGSTSSAKAKEAKKETEEGSRLKEAEELIKHLTKDELYRLRSRIKLNLDNGMYANGTPVEQAKESSDEHLLLDVIIWALKQRGAEFPIMSHLVTTSAYINLRKKTPEVFTFLRQVKCTDVELRYLLGMSVHLLIEDIRKRSGAIASARQLMSQIHRIPQVINLEFPGYAETGMLHMIFQQGRRR